MKFSECELNQSKQRFGIRIAYRDDYSKRICWIKILEIDFELFWEVVSKCFENNTSSICKYFSNKKYFKWFSQNVFKRFSLLKTIMIILLVVMDKIKVFDFKSMILYTDTYVSKF